MFAVVNIQGYQFKVEEGQEIFVQKLDKELEDVVNFEEVLLLDSEGKVSIGKPFVTGASVQAKVIDHVKGDKVIVFKKKKRKGYQVKKGHRQQYSKIEIQQIKA